jgi:hypothetical protein
VADSYASAGRISYLNVALDLGSHIGSATCMGGPDSKDNYTMNAASDTNQQGQAGPGNPQVQQVVITRDGEVVSGPPNLPRKVRTG